MKLQISKSYENKRVFDNLRLDIAEGEITCVLGVSGAGKTTLLNILCGLTDFDGEILGLPKKIGYCFQTPRLVSHLSVRENLVYVGASQTQVQAMLQRVGLTAHADKKPSALSGGEKQRVAIARAFLLGEELLLLDEPFSFLDLAWKAELLKLFVELWQEKKPTAVFVTHDIEEAWAIAHRILLLDNGQIVYDVKPNRKQYPAPFGEADEQKAELYNKVLGLRSL